MAAAAGALVGAFRNVFSVRALPRLGAGLVALTGLVLIVVGGVQSASRAGDSPTGTFTSAGKQPVVGAIGLLDLGGPRVTVQATGSGSVFLGIARAADVDAFLAGAARTELTGYDGNGGLTSRTQGSAAMPDPSGSDIWVLSTRGQGAVSLVWPDAPGQWRLVAAGATAGSGPRTLTMIWTGEQQHSAVPELIAVGLLLLVAGGVTLALLWSRERLGPLDPTAGTGPQDDRDGGDGGDGGDDGNGGNGGDGRAGPNGGEPGRYRERAGRR